MDGYTASVMPLPEYQRAKLKSFNQSSLFRLDDNEGSFILTLMDENEFSQHVTISNDVTKVPGVFCMVGSIFSTQAGEAMRYVNLAQFHKVDVDILDIEIKTKH